MSSTPYDRQTSFALFSAENPNRQIPGTDLDAEFNAVKVAVDDTQQNLGKIQDDDGALARGSVGREQLGASILLGFSAPHTWQPDTTYTADTSTVFNANKFYIAIVTHISGASFEPANWEMLADFTTSAVIDDGSISTAKLADNAVQTAKIADGSVTSTKLATNSVATAKIADSAVITQKIADGAVTFSKLAAAAISSLTSTIRPGGAINLEDFGTVGDGVVDDRAAIQNAINAAALLGATVYGSSGKTYRAVINGTVTDNGLILKAGVRLNLNGATINLECTGSVYGIRLQSNSHISDGTVATTVSVSPGSQSIWHAPICLGAALGEVVSVGALGNYINATRWSVKRLKLTNARAGGYKIAGIGGISHGVIEDIEYPDDSTSVGCLNFDWGTVGNISSSAASMAANLALFNAGTAYTVHPNNIDVRRLKIGAMTNAASSPIRLSGVHDIRIDEFEIVQSNTASVTHTAGDLGYEFADANSKRWRHTGIVIKNGLIRYAGNGIAIACDAFADNVAVAVTSFGYTSLLPPINPTDILFENIKAIGSIAPSANDGIQCFWMEGGTFRNCSMVGFNRGARFANGCKRTSLLGGECSSSQQEGVYIGDSTTLPEEITVEGVWAYSNGIAGSYAGINAANGKLHTLNRNRLGTGGDSFQDIGLRVDPTCTDVTAEGNHVIAASSAAYVVGSASSFNCVRMFRNNTAAAGVGATFSGVSILAIDYAYTAAGLVRRFKTTRSTMSTTPGSGSWNTGDIIEFTDAQAGGTMGSYCVTGGTPGTWKNLPGLAA